jgi:MFS family permease
VGSRELLPSELLVAAVGVLFIGPFMVVFPLLIRDYYGGDELWFGLVQAAFPVGTIMGSLLILLRGGIRRKGLAQVGALVAGSVCLAVISLGLPFVGTLIAIALWGSAAAVFMNSGRTVFQERASAENRGRVLSVYTLGFIGAAGLIGAPLCGLLVEAVGPLFACAVNAGSMLVVVAAIAVSTPILSLE